MAEVLLPANSWKPRAYQLPLWKYLERGGKRAAVIWPRRHGKDLTAINWTAVSSQMRIGTYWLVYPLLNQGRRIAWNGITKEGVRFIDAFPRELIQSSHNDEMRLNLKNGSVFQIMGADQPDKFVGANPVGIVFSEWPLMNPQVWKLTAPILAENDGWALFIYTPRGANHGLTLLTEARLDPKWFTSKLTVKDTKILTKEALQNLRKELKDEALFQQEMFTSFTAPMQGAYYDNQMKFLMKNKRIGNVPMEPKLPVNTAWDLGYDDATSIWFFQQHHSEVRIIDYYENSGEGLLHYIKVLQSKGYLYGKHYGPWDLTIHDLGTGKTRIETARDMGLKFTPVKKIGVAEGIEACRNLLPRCWFNKETTESGVNCLKSYRKEWDEARQVFKSTPLHDWSSHAADSFRTLAVGIKDLTKKNKPQQYTFTEYDPFNQF